MPLPPALTDLDVHEDMLSLIGDTPLLALQRMSPEGGATIIAKMEMFNPGLSVKDRLGLALIDDAEQRGVLKPGGIVVEATGSCNTGAGLAMVALLRGYRCILTAPDKNAPEKIDNLRALGAEVHVCPTAVEPDDPRSYYEVAKRLAKETGGFLANQYYNPANPAIHEATTGPEIWEQTKGTITHLVVGVGTGGTITGIGRYLKKQNPDVHIVGVDAVGSIYTQPDDIHSYKIEGIGEDFWPETFDRTLVDSWVTVDDPTAYRVARETAAKEGLLLGSSSGAAVHAAQVTAAKLTPDEVLVVLLPDSGRAYLSKVFNDTWLAEHNLI